MRLPRSGLAVLALISLSPQAPAQIAEPNQLGVSMGHLHFLVDDVAANRDFWVRLGGEDFTFPAGTGVRLPGVLILISERASASKPSTIDHVAFRVTSLEGLSKRGFSLELLEDYPGIASIRAPSGDRVELFEESSATNIGFAADVDDATANRLNLPLTGMIDSHHVHFYLPPDQVLIARDWYVRHFGAISGMRWRYDAADLPGMNLNFSSPNAAGTAAAMASLDHIGFEVANLAEFCDKLEAQGIEFDQPLSRLNPDFAFATLTDPWGTTIELTEGLTAY